MTPGQEHPDRSTTVVVPCYNHGRFVRAAVRSALDQADADVRVVVVDDGSTDGRSPGDCDACRGPRVEVLHQRNTGLPGARNVGAALEGLGERQRIAIILVHYQGFTNGETAALLDCSIEAVESLLARARRALRDSLAPVAHDLLGEH